MLGRRLAQVAGYPAAFHEYKVIQQTPGFKDTERQIDKIQAKYAGGLRVRACRKGSTRNTLAVLRRVQRRIRKRGERHRDFIARLATLLDGE